VNGTYSVYIVYGPEGCGKTALFRQAVEVLRNYGYEVVYVNPITRTFGDMILYTPSIRGVVEGVFRLFPDPYSRIVDAAINVVRDVVRRFSRPKVALLVDDMFQAVGFNRAEAYVKALLNIIEYPPADYENIVVILTGSMPGLLEKIVSPAEPREPGFARYIEEINIPRWSIEETVEFLREGLRERNIVYREEELYEVHEELSGIPGFISYYGLLRTKGLEHRKALDRTISYAISQWENDLRSFLNIYSSPLYMQALAILAETVTGTSWSELERELERKTGRKIGKSTLYRILANLIKAGMVQKHGDKYIIPDRSLRRAVAEIVKRQPLYQIRD